MNIGLRSRPHQRPPGWWRPGRIDILGVMGRSLRSQFLKRISSVGWGVRESVQTVLGGVVTQLREQVADHSFAEEDLEQVIAFHDEVESLWRDSLATAPTLAVDELGARLDLLLGACIGPLRGVRVHLERAREHLKALAVTKQVREAAPRAEE